MRRKNLLASLRSVIFCSALSSILGFAAFAAPPKYPLLMTWQDQVWLTGKDGKRQLVRSKQVLQDKAVLETSTSGSVKVQLDAHRSFTLMPSSEASLPVISWEGGEAPVLFLRSGEMRWEQSLKEKGTYNTALRSDIFEFIAPPGEYVLTMNPAKAYAGVKVLEGALTFSAMNGEESVRLKTGQQAGFQGVLEEGEIAYDILLKGKKIPKGRLTAVTAVDPSEMGKKAAAEKKRLADEAKKDRQQKAATAQAKQAGFICDKPQAKFNQCVWRRLEGKGVTGCVRQRCNANGEWAEQTLLSAEKASSLCKAQAVVAPCDY